MNQRCEYIDLSKGIGIFCVVLGHILPQCFLHEIIYSFHMPLFFIVSGWLIAKREVMFTSKSIKKRFKQLIYPYFVFSGVYIIWEIIVNAEGVVGTLYLLYRTITFRGMAPLWFLPSLFVAEVIVMFFATKESKITVSFLIVVYLLNSIAYSKLDLQSWGGIVSNPLTFILRTSICTVFVLCGFCGNKVLKIIRPYITNKRILVLCVFSLGTMCGSTYSWNVDVNLHLYEMNNLNAFLITGLCGSVGVITASYLLGYNKLLTLWGRNTLTIMVLHYPITQLFTKTFSYQIKNNFLHVSLCICGTIIFVTLLSLVGGLFTSQKRRISKRV